MKIAKLGNQINEKELAKQCAIHVVTCSFFKKGIADARKQNNTKYYDRNK